MNALPLTAPIMLKINREQEESPSTNKNSSIYNFETVDIL